MIEPQDYLEPPCPLDSAACSCGGAHRHAPRRRDAAQRRIPLAKVIAECDALFNAEKIEELGSHLRRWLAEARAIEDRQSELSLLSELMGHYRMTGDKERGLQAVRDGFRLLAELGIGGSVSAGTILINGATALKEFGETEEALARYADAFRCYDNHLDPNDWHFASLLNNMAAAYAEAGDVERAEAHYGKALDVLAACGNRVDAAVTHVNLAQLRHQIDPEDERIAEDLERALECLNDPEVKRDGYYAHTCRKCASAFGFFGWFRDEADLNKRAGAIYHARA